MPSKLSQPAPPLYAYLREINATPLLDADEERDLACRVEQGDREARDHMVRANLRLVVSLAKRYVGRGLAMEDLVAEGNMGLLRAAEGFDPSVGVRFSTYASYWVKQSIRRALTNTGRAVRLPSHMVDLLAKWGRASATLRLELGRDPGQEEVAGRLGLSAKKLSIVRKALRVRGAAALGGEGGTGANLQGNELTTGGTRPGAELERAEEVHQALGQLALLGPREARVLRLRFGLAGEEPMTLKAIGGRLGLTRERARQIEAEALAKMHQALGRS